ncbi:MAG: ABC transporter permease [Petrotogales bacterium]
MKSFWNFFRFHLFADLRNRRSIFWVILFPMLLFSILVLTFTNMGLRESIEFKALLIDETPGNATVNYSGRVIKALEKLSYPNEEALFKIEKLDVKEKEYALKLLRYARADILIIIPEDFNTKFAGLAFSSSLGLPFSQTELKIYFVPSRASSNLARGTIEAVMSSINSQLAKDFNYEVDRVKVNSETIGAIMVSPSYTNFVAPGIIVIAVFMSGTFLVGPKIAIMRRFSILKKYATTPIPLSSFYFGFTFSRVFIMIVQYIGLGLFGIYVLKATVSLFAPDALIYYLYLCAVYTAIGFALGFISTSPAAQGAISGFLTLPLQFLSGIYFPLFNLPWYINVFVYSNPLYYSANAMREYMGVAYSVTPMWVNYLVPGIWLAISVLFSLTRRLSERG